MPKITVKNERGETLYKVEAEIIGDIFAIHKDIDHVWIVTHLPTGLHCIQWNHKNYPFDTREQAVTYVNALLEAKIMWSVTTRDELFQWNTREMVEAIVTGARFTAGAMVTG